MRRMRRTKTVDMSPDAVDQRLRDLTQLYKLGISVRDAKYLGTVEELKCERPVSETESRCGET